MPVINEEDDGSHALPQDFSELLDLPDSAFAGLDDALLGSTLAEDSLAAPSGAQAEGFEYDLAIRSIYEHADDETLQQLV